MIDNIGHRSRVLLSIEEPMIFSNIFVRNETKTVPPEENGFESSGLVFYTLILHTKKADNLLLKNLMYIRKNIYWRKKNRG